MKKAKILVQSKDIKPIQIDKFMTIYPYFNKEMNNDVSIIAADLDGHHSKRVNHKSSKSYYVLSGKLSITIENNTSTLKKGDALMLNAGIRAEMRGEKAKLLIITAPGFNPDDETIE